MTAIKIKRIRGGISAPYISLLLRLLLGGLLVVAGISKLPMHSSFVEIVQSYQLLPDPLATAYALALPWIELLIGSYLILGILTKPSAVITILVGISFMLANISAIIRGEYFCPNCFGESFPLTASQALIIDVFIIFAAILLMIAAKRDLLGFDGWFARKWTDRK